MTISHHKNATQQIQLSTQYLYLLKWWCMANSVGLECAELIDKIVNMVKTIRTSSKLDS